MHGAELRRHAARRRRQLPNPAFPTFGGVDGGFEVHMTEGFAHVDVLTAEDDGDNNVLAPLAAFIGRNVAVKNRHEGPRVHGSESRPKPCGAWYSVANALRPPLHRP